MTEAEQFEAVLRELAELLLDLGDLARRVVLVGGQVLAIESRRRGGTGVIDVRTETGIVIPRGFSMEPDLLMEMDEDTFEAERLVEVLKERNYQRVRDFRWSKPLPAGSPGTNIELDLFRDPAVPPEVLPTRMTPLPDAGVVFRHCAEVTLAVGELELPLTIPDPVAFVAMKVRAKLEQRPTAHKDCFDLYAYVKLVGAAVVTDALSGAGALGAELREKLRGLFWDARAPGVLDVLTYAGSLDSEERLLLAQDAIDTFADVVSR